MSLQLPKNRNSFGYDHLRSFQKGGNVGISDEEKQALFPYFAQLYSQQMNPEKYGSASSIEEWTALLQENEEDMNTIAKAASQLTDQDWEALGTQYAEVQQGRTENPASPQLIETAAKGAKIKQLKAQAGSKMQRAAVSAQEPPYLSKIMKKAEEADSTDVLKKISKINATRKANADTTKAISNPVLTKGAEGMEIKKKVLPKTVKKKCSCGCDMILSKAAGGKVIETCACKCGGKMKKKK